MEMVEKLNRYGFFLWVINVNVINYIFVGVLGLLEKFMVLLGRVVVDVLCWFVGFFWFVGCVGFVVGGGILVMDVFLVGFVDIDVVWVVIVF